MDRVGAREFRDADHLVDRQIALDRAQVALQMVATAHLIALVGLEPVQRKLVLLGPDCDRLDAEFVGRAKDTDGDFGPVGDENFGN